MEVHSVRVHWPGGDAEEFVGLQANGHFQLREGTGQAEEWTSAGDQQSSPPSPANTTLDPTDRVVLAARLPLPILNWVPAGRSTSQLLSPNGRPMLICFWATWCTPCLNELQQLSGHAEQLAELGIDVRLLGVDGLDLAQSSTASDGLAMLRRLSVPFTAGSATRETLDKLALIEQIVLSRQSPIAVPYSLLIDSEGLVASLYRGPLDVATLMRDMQQLDVGTSARRDQAVPFAGRWVTPPKMMLLRPVANVFYQRGYSADAQQYRELELTILQRRRQQARSADEVAAIDRQYAQACGELGRLAHSQGLHDEALEYFRAALEGNPQSIDLRFWLGSTLRKLGKHSEAIDQLHQVVSSDDHHAAAQLELSKALLSDGQPAAAVTSAAIAAELTPYRVDAQFQLGVALLASQESDRAFAAFQRALAANPDHVDSLINLGAILASHGKPGQAAEYLERAVALRLIMLTPS